MNPKKTLVVYYSRTGTTRIVARMLGRALACDVEPITERVDRRSGVFGYLRSGFDAMFGRRTDLRPMHTNPSDYDLVVVGTPIWNASVSAPIRTYLEDNARSIGQLAFFCTHGGSGSARVLRQMQEIVGREPVMTLVLRTEEVKHDSASVKVRAFAAALGAPPSSGRISLRPPTSLRPAPT